MHGDPSILFLRFFVFYFFVFFSSYIDNKEKLHIFSQTSTILFMSCETISCVNVLITTKNCQYMHQGQQIKGQK
jgi:hypothetical protein